MNSPFWIVPQKRGFCMPVDGFNVGSLNVRGCRTIEEQNTLISDIYKYKIELLAVSETHIKGTGIKSLKYQTKDNNAQKYSFFWTGNDTNHHHGVGIIADETLNPRFYRISDRICSATISTCDRRLTFISAYAPTTPACKKDPDQREEFYTQLDSCIDKIANRDIVIVAGDFNAKVGSGWHDFPSVVGKFGKGHVNTNGERLIELCSKHELCISNTLFKHKLAHTTT